MALRDSAPCLIYNRMESVFADLIPGFDPANDDTLAGRSAVLWTERISKSTPVLLPQGTSDWRVSPHSALEMGHAFLRAGHPFRLVLLEGSDHALSEHAAERDRLTPTFIGAPEREAGFSSAEGQGVADP